MIAQLGTGIHALLGNKARYLDALAHAGLPVPSGFAVPLAAARSGVLPTEVVLPGALWAVRSSGTGEDQVGSAQAGAFRSRIRVDAGDLPEALRDVAASLDERQSEGGVIVQEWIEGTVSGVAFSQHPARDLEFVVISAASGGAEGVVSGQAQTEEIFAWQGGQLQQEKSVLPETVVRKLHDLVRRAEQVVGRPTDVEWTWDGTKLWLLQARPMTALPEPNPIQRAEEERVIRACAGRPTLFLDRSDFAESVPMPGPRSLSLLRSLYAVGGPADRAAAALGLMRKKGGADAYLVTVFGKLYADKERELYAPRGVLGNLRAAWVSGRALRSAPSESLRLLPELVADLQKKESAEAQLLGAVGEWYTRVSMLQRLALNERGTGGVDLAAWAKGYNSARVALLALAEERRVDWDLRTPLVPIRSSLSSPNNLSDLYTLLKEDAKQLVGLILGTLPSEQAPDVFADIHPPIHIRHHNLFDLFRPEVRTDGQPGGIGVSPGTATAVVWQPHNELQKPLLEPFILVVEAFTPSWFGIMDLPALKGVVAETGSLLSHGAIQLRERKVPAVFGCVGARAAWPAGTQLTMDGQRGLVTSEGV